MSPLSIFWHRRDLRLDDNHGLFRALQGDVPVLPLFILDRNILDDLEERDDARVTFIHQQLERLQAEYRAAGGDLRVEYGFPLEVWGKLLNTLPIKAVYTNRDYEPYARERDAGVEKLLAKHDIPLHTFKDQVVFEYDEVLKDDGSPYTVFTPYSRKWKALLEQTGIPSHPSRAHLANLSKVLVLNNLPSLDSIDFATSSLQFPSSEVPQGLIKNYGATRDFPGIQGTSRLGIHFRFGTISIREKARKARDLSETYLNELIWRDFYAMILAHFPHVVGRPFKKAYENIEWRNDPAEFQAWREGRTGYPIVDAGMRELAATGYMHNRVRMVAASFLTKHLLIDWRWGEAWFARKLLDYDLASNNGGWQWAAGCGTDAAPYFRVFNPTAQQEKFDPELKYVRKWVPEYGTGKYPAQIVEHKMARERCLTIYKKSLPDT
ncbi:MAG: deoxyribodipyrimidine photo-lyase [Saprospirales bacterium]|nr:deoxyribodipyrimidine photo-lyase [Saprospirales bacterium]